jgi:glycerol-3-phosphate dehydrogenase
MPSATSNTTAQNVYDLAVIGAGINGLGIAKDAAERGLSVVLVEQEDLCSGVSAWSGRLVHGGLRYLEHMDLALVRESLKERERLFKLAPHLVKPVELIMPFYKKNRRPAWMIWLGMIAYDMLSLDKSVSFHRILGKDKVKKRFSGMAGDGLGGAALFIDGQVEYAERLCVELGIAAAENGADIRIHERVVGFEYEANRVAGVQVLSASGEKSSIRAKAVVNAAGPWVDRVNDKLQRGSTKRLIGGTKGSHIIVDPFPGAPNDVVYYESQADGRLVLVIPWMGRYLIGTTDTKFDLDPDAARADQTEVEYLLREVNALIPESGLTHKDILFTYSGVRPLPYAPGVSEWKIPRSHIVLDHTADSLPGLYSVVGGKLTTFRQLAQDAVDLVLKKELGQKRACINKKLMFPGAQDTNWDALKAELLADGVIQPDTVERLVALYGSRARLIVDYARSDSALAERFDPLSAAIAAELLVATKHEFAQTLTDIYARRILLAFEPGHGLESVPRATQILAELLGWDSETTAHNIRDYQVWLDHLKVPELAGAN